MVVEPIVYLYVIYMHICIYIYSIYLWMIYGSSMDMVGGIGTTPLKHMSSSVGMMTFQTEWENIGNVPVTTNQSRFVSDLQGVFRCEK